MSSLNALAGRPGWLLDEVTSAGRENLDPEHVARYDRKEDAGAIAEVALLRQLGLDEQSVIVDLGAGTGQFALAVAPFCSRVVAVDVSPFMLAAVTESTRAASIGNIEIVNAGFLTYEHVADSPDFVYSRYALHHLPDFWKAVAIERVHQMIEPGGLFRLSDVVYNFPPDEAEARIESWCATAGNDLEDEWGRSELEEHVRDENSTFTWLLEPMIERCGFVTEQSTGSDDDFVATYLLRAT